MATAIHLLGAPLLIRDGVVYATPRGRKVWALLAYLALSHGPPSRQQLIDLLFTDAEDPAGALRWNLSELRRLLGGPDTVGSGNVVQLRLPAGTVVDVLVLMGGTSGEAVDLPGLGRELLEGMDIDASPGFTAWLLGERRRLLSLSEAVLREGALRALASGNARTAVELATRLVAADPLNEDGHVLLVRAFAATGDDVAVERQVAASVDLFRRELGVEPGPELIEAGTIDEVGRPPADVGTGRASLAALVESGDAAVNAGAIEAGLESLRNAVAGARASGDTEIETAALLSLGSALIHATKGKDEEGAAALHRSITAAETTGQRSVAASAHRELGYVELLRGDYPRAAVWLRTAQELGGEDPLELARIQAVRGTCLGDVGSHDQAAEVYGESIALADSLGKPEAESLGDGVPGPDPTPSERARRRRSNAPRGMRGGAQRTLDGVHRVPRGAGGRGVGPQRRSGPRLRDVRACVRARVPGERRLLGGLRRSWTRTAPRRAWRSGRVDRADGGRVDPMCTPAGHPSLAARVRPRRALRGRGHGEPPHGGGVGHRSGVAGRPLGHARTLRPRLPLPTRPGRPHGR